MLTTAFRFVPAIAQGAKFAAIVAGATLACAAQAQVTVTDPWIRATVAQQKATGAFMQLVAAKDTRLVAVTTPLTPKAEVHEMAMQDNVMRMRQVPAVELPAGQLVALKPGGYHVMLLDLPRQVKAGETVALTLVFEDKTGARQSVEVKAPVRALNATMKMAPMAPKADKEAGHGEHAH
ncbi:copper chaperone PCu(A)C [Mitsuaria sp. GD03876]|uniref:copper chaperone PCu(A)C n=1 Tax=Mitsuaria sp. GD03876 TaxID=2975399 RepID=UPI0024497D52|nr:copper chaperone PCu(A)C [Mitsuaria sp. GD03876]MDH0865755.1 copper chaperone PCu(A)C [Mitsuaria sp. GD03876]